MRAATDDQQQLGVFSRGGSLQEEQQIFQGLAVKDTDQIESDGKTIGKCWFNGGFIVIYSDLYGYYPLVMTIIAMEKAIEIVDFPITSMVIFHSYVKLPEGRML